MVDRVAGGRPRKMLAECYFEQIAQMTGKIANVELKVISVGAKMIADSVMKDGIFHVFGSGHSAIIAKEIAGRAGGLVPVNAISDPTEGMAERIEGYGKDLLARYAEKYGLEPGEVMIVVSTSGRNPLPIEIAMEAKKRGLSTIAITSMEYSRQVTSRHRSGKRLFEVVDLVLDNCAPPGDAIVEVEGLAQKLGPASTITGALLANMLILRIIEEILNQRRTPPVLMSQNLDGADEHNRALKEKYRHRLAW